MIIGTGSKDRWNATDPDAETQFVDFYLNSRLATAIRSTFGEASAPGMSRRLMSADERIPHLTAAAIA